MEDMAAKLSSSLKRESTFFVGRERERSGIQILTRLLEDLDTFLDGADAKSAEKVMTESVNGWLEQTEENSEELEGCLEQDCLLSLSRILQEPRIVNFLGRAGRRFSKLNAARNGAPLPPPPPVAPNIKEGKLFSSFIDDYVDSATKDVMAWLMDEAPERSVFALVGPRGIGKTDLVRKAYDSEEVRGRFDCCCWVDVSRCDGIPGVIRSMIEQAARRTRQDSGEIGNPRRMQFFGTLRRALEAKRYMLVFKDVFHERFWDAIADALPENKKGSRIIVTTASDIVGESCERGSFDRVYRQEPLSDAMSWELFTSIAFLGEPEMRCPTELEPLSRGIVRMCKGFQLSIVGLADLLSRKEKLVSEWKKLYENFRLEMRMNPGPPGVVEVLTLSYRDLPEHLIPCFLYFSVFPEDALIPNDKLFRLWIAEGFVEEENEKALEEVAEDYLNQLILRGLVQPCRGLYGLNQFCQVRRMIHDFARQMSEEMNFCQIRDERNSSSGKMCSRLSICSSNVYSFTENIDTRVRSLFVFKSSFLSFDMVCQISNKFTILTMLDFENHSMEYVPQELGNLVHLKYLSLKNSKVKQLPESVQKLQNLQTLDVRNTLISELRVEINKLKNLQHLLATGPTNRTSGDWTQGVRVRKGIGELSNLRTLTTVEAQQRSIGIVEELAKLKQLRALSVSGLSAQSTTALCACIDEFKHLKSLRLRARNNNEPLNLEGISTRLPHLRHLVLKGTLGRLPDWIPCLQNLSTLCLSYSLLTEDPLMKLSHLPNLEALWLCKAFEGEQLYFEEGDFTKLKLLDIRELHGLNALKIEDGALPCLEELRIGSIPGLNEVPSGIQHLRNLKVLASYDMPDEYVLGMLPDGGPDYWKVKHIPSVIFLYRVQGRNYKLLKLGDSDFLDQLRGSSSDRSYGVLRGNDEYELSFCESDDDDEDGREDDNAGQLSISSVQSNNVRGRSTSQWSFSSGFYTDDVEE